MILVLFLSLCFKIYLPLNDQILKNLVLSESVIQGSAKHMLSLPLSFPKY